MALLQGECVPEGVGIDADGAATTDPRRVLDGAQLPFGGQRRRRQPVVGAAGCECHAALPSACVLRDRPMQFLSLHLLLLLLAGHKGSSIALMVELLAAGLTGSPFAFEAAASDPDDTSRTPTMHGELIICIDPGMLQPDSGEGSVQRAEALFAELLGEPGLRLPSQRRYDAREEVEALGVVLTPSKAGLWEKAQHLAGASS